MKLPVTYLFVPGNRPERFDKALAVGRRRRHPRSRGCGGAGRQGRARVPTCASGSTRIATPPTASSCASTIGPTPVVRRGPRAASARRHPLSRCCRRRRRPKQVAAVRAALPQDGHVLPLIETARGVENVDAIASAPGVAAAGVRYARLRASTSICPATSAASSIRRRGSRSPRAVPGSMSPVAGVTRPSTTTRACSPISRSPARSDSAPSCAFTRSRSPSSTRRCCRRAAEIDWAKRVLAAAEGAAGAVQVDGKMVDRPVLLKARAILDRLPS